MEADKVCYRTKQEIKRQRTSSRSPSASPVLESEDDSTKASAPKQKPRGAAARSQHQKEQREKDRDKERTEAANRRKGRAERRKGDGRTIPCATRVPADSEQITSLLKLPPHPPRTKSRPCLQNPQNSRPQRHPQLKLGHRPHREEAVDRHKKRAVGSVVTSTHEIRYPLPMAYRLQTPQIHHNRALQMVSAMDTTVAMGLLEEKQPSQRTGACRSCRGMTYGNLLVPCKTT